LNIISQKNVQLDIIEMSGKKISTHFLTNGNQSVDVSKLSNGVYLMNFTTADGQKLAQKFVKR
jgi:hypothetical protein